MEPINPQEFMKRLYEAEYDMRTLNSEDMSIRTYAEGYNTCLAHIRQTLIMKYGARPLTKQELKQLDE